MRAIPFVSNLGNHDVELPFMSASSIHDYLRRARPQAGQGALFAGNGLVRGEDQNDNPLRHVWLLDYMHRYCLACDHGGYSVPFVGGIGGYINLYSAVLPAV